MLKSAGKSANDAKKIEMTDLDGKLLSENVRNFRDILNYKNQETGKHYQTIKRRKEKEKFLKKFTMQTEKTHGKVVKREMPTIEKITDKDND